MKTEVRREKKEREKKKKVVGTTLDPLLPDTPSYKEEDVVMNSTE
jgi:hypothetical protein